MLGIKRNTHGSGWKCGDEVLVDGVSKIKSAWKSKIEPYSPPMGRNPVRQDSRLQATGKE